VLFSAIAMGRPLVLSDVGGFSEFAGQGAELVPPGDAAALAETLAALLRDDARREQLAGEARTAGRDRYSWSAIARQYGELYPELAGAGMGYHRR
jgi:glycosyltransferase involved in cell wall biosynthesis